MLSGRPGLVRIRATESGEVIEIDRGQLLLLVQTDSELGDIFMRAFILRRVELIARGFGDVVLVGSTHCSGTLRVKEFLTRNGHPYSYIDLDRDQVERILDPADLELLAVKCTGLDGAAIVIRHEIVVLGAAADASALVRKRGRALLVAVGDQVGGPLAGGPSSRSRGGT